jgi:predicted RNA-binding protein with PIN domain
MTSHASQGKTTDKIIISQSSLSGKASSIEQFYVSVSRGRQAVSIYTDDKAELIKAVAQSTQRISATELLEKNSKVKAVIEQGRILMFEKIKDKARGAIDKLKAKTNELPGKDRTA